MLLAFSTKVYKLRPTDFSGQTQHMLLLAEDQTPKAESSEVETVGNHLLLALKPAEASTNSELGNH